MSSPEVYFVYAWHTRPAGGADDLMEIVPDLLTAEAFIKQLGRSITAYQIVRVFQDRAGTWGYTTVEEVA